MPLRARCCSNALMSSKRCFQMSPPVSGSVWCAEQLGVHADGQHFLVVRSIEDGDLAARWQHQRVAPQEVVRQLGTVRRAKARHAHALWIQPRDHMLDHAVLAGRVERLQHDQQRVAARGVEDVVQVAQPLEVARQLVLRLVLVPEAERLARGKVVEIDLVPRSDAQLVALQLNTAYRAPDADGPPRSVADQPVSRCPACARAGSVDRIARRRTRGDRRARRLPRPARGACG